VELVGFIDGMKGLNNENFLTIEEGSFKYYRNLGGYDYLGKSTDAIRT
jgi:6-phosphofructokinase